MREDFKAALGSLFPRGKTGIRTPIHCMSFSLRRDPIRSIRAPAPQGCVPPSFRVGFLGGTCPALIRFGRLCGEVWGEGSAGGGGGGGRGLDGAWLLLPKGRKGSWRPRLRAAERLGRFAVIPRELPFNPGLWVFLAAGGDFGWRLRRLRRLPKGISGAAGTD